jgi:Ca-activated chloride channel family protein
VSDALETARNAFDESASSQKVILVITDGEAHDAGVLATAQRLADEGIALYTIGFGSPEGAPVPQLDAWGNVIGYKTDENGQQVLSRLDEATLQQIADVGGGEYWLASPRAEELDALVSALATLQQGSFGARTDVQRIERYQWFLGASFLLLAASLFVPERRAFVRRSRSVPPQEVTMPTVAASQNSTKSQGVA